MPETNSSVQSAEDAPEERISLAREILPAKPRHPMETLLKNGAGALLKVGDMVEGVFMERRGTRIFFDLGPLGTGIVYGREYYAAQELIKDLKPGDRIAGKVIELDNDDGYRELSLQQAGRERRWIDLKRMMDEGVILELPVRKANTGGLIIEYLGVEGFLPASQLAAKHYPRVDGGEKEKILQELQKLVDTSLRVKILDLDPAENKLIFSERRVENEAMREAIARYKKGDIVEGEITGVVDFGAFVRLDDTGIEGLIHLSEIDWLLVENPRERFKLHDRVRAKIIDIQGDKISLSLKHLKDDPWLAAAHAYHKGDVVSGKVIKLNPFGAFVQVGDSLQGLIHVSEFGNEEKLRRELAVGEEYQFTILLWDPENHKMSLGPTQKQ